MRFERQENEKSMPFLEKSFKLIMVSKFENKFKAGKLCNGILDSDEVKNCRIGVA